MQVADAIGVSRSFEELRSDTGHRRTAIIKGVVYNLLKLLAKETVALQQSHQKCDMCTPFDLSEKKL